MTVKEATEKVELFATALKGIGDRIESIVYNLEDGGDLVDFDDFDEINTTIHRMMDDSISLERLTWNAE